MISRSMLIHRMVTVTVGLDFHPKELTQFPLLIKARQVGNKAKRSKAQLPNSAQQQKLGPVREKEEKEEKKKRRKKRKRENKKEREREQSFLDLMVFFIFISFLNFF